MKPRLFFISAIGLLNCQSLFAQTTQDYTVVARLAVHDSPPSLEFHWPLDTSVSNYSISRKAKASATWSLLGSNLPDTLTTFVDTNLAIGDAFEYRFTKSSTTVNAFTYFYSGIQVPAIEQRGKIILI